jgi:hypothetical protein
VKLYVNKVHFESSSNKFTTTEPIPTTPLHKTMAPSAINILEESTHDNQTKGNIIRVNGSSEFSSSAGVAIGKRLISQAMKQRIQEIDQDICEAGEEDTFFVADMGDVYRQHLRWKMNLSRVKPHYGKKRILKLSLCSTKAKVSDSSCQMQPRPSSPASSRWTRYWFRLCFQSRN